ncbi:DMT family transporter [Asanoa sp. NPDC050611]|uniref:DMT family transporter n=1 Tax=Asanoa sp. NPDC050611 TaxID=3157098 RepID=UPI0033D9A047
MGLVLAIVSAICYGSASVFQAVAARRAPASDTVDAKSLIRVFAQWPYLIGLALDGAGFVAQFIALRGLPIFLVQAALAASLAVTAVVAIPILKLRLGPIQWLAVAGVCVGLALLGVSAGHENADQPSWPFRIGLTISVPVLALLGLAAIKLKDPARAAVLGLVGGLFFGIVALAARSISDVDFVRWFTGPEIYTLVVAGGLAFVFYTIGLQRASVTTVTAGLVIGETVLPSIVGVVALGDSTRRGFIPVAAVGFALAVAASLMLARYGSLEESEEGAAASAKPELQTD